MMDRLAGSRPEPRRATLAALRDPQNGEVLDRALLLWMPGPDSVTGEDVAELHLHGGRAVVDGVTAVLAQQPGLREAVAGEFTRRAFENNRIDLNEAEGLADLLVAETQGQRRAALLAAGGALSRTFQGWEKRLLDISAGIEAAIDYSDEDDVGDAAYQSARHDAAALRADIGKVLERPRAERLKDGVRIVFAGPPNSGKSSLVNALAGREAAIESASPGTTRDTIEVPIAIAGIPMLLIDTAGLRDAQDEIEAIGIRKAQRAAEAADIVVWLGDEQPLIPDVFILPIHSRADVRPPHPHRLAVSARNGQNLDILVAKLVAQAQTCLPSEGEIALNSRQHRAASVLRQRLLALILADDPLVAAFEAQDARQVCDTLTGRSGVEDMLDALFSRFCVGK